MEHEGKLWLITDNGEPSCIFKTEERADNFLRKRRDPNADLDLSHRKWEKTAVWFNE